eukprot:CAMPEP_0170509022 /NCGR_PEP_ID=MMETSP0208-20121228/64151_1 /TAXON_ID=197538 /ORGANISM="Strombidium inclinatum, Strain S3" /LENGTH=47 /DNA_ID= /DNA_START= /DNA_END= /DNA_ORIENTATION=
MSELKFKFEQFEKELTSKSQEDQLALLRDLEAECLQKGIPHDLKLLL